MKSYRLVAVYPDGIQSESLVSVESYADVMMFARGFLWASSCDIVHVLSSSGKFLLSYNR